MVLSNLSCCSVAVVLLSSGLYAMGDAIAAQQPVHLTELRTTSEGPTEEELEESFLRSRDRLRDSPEYSGSDAQAHFRLAERLAHGGDVRGATEEYRTAIRLQPDFAQAYRGLGQVLLGHHDYAGAELSLRQYVQADATDGEVFYWLARAQMGLGRLDEAEQSLQRVAELKPDDPEPYADLALVRMAQGQVRAAGEALDQALRLRPDAADVHRLMEMLTVHRDDQAALRHRASRMLEDIFARE